MRVIVLLLLALAAIWYVPRLWQSAMANRVEALQANDTTLPPEPEIDRQIDSVDPANAALKMTPPVAVVTNKYQGVDEQHQVDEAIRRSGDLHQQSMN